MASPSSVLAVVRAARPQLRSRADALAFALHASLCCEGFVLVAAGEAARAQGSAALVHEVGPEGWQDAEDEYTFRYTRDGAQSGLYQLSALTAGDKLLVDAAPPAPARVAHLELSLAEFTTGQLSDGYAAAFRNLEGLLARVQASLLPALKPGTARSRSLELDSQAAEPPAARGEGRGEGNAHGARGEERDWRPEFRGVGDQDLYPTGMPRLPVLGPFGPGAGGGMLIGPHHPGFFPGGELPGHPARPPNLPPSARFDPFGPPGVPGFEPGQFGGGRGRGRGGIPGQAPPVHPDIMQLGRNDDSMFG